MSFREGVAFRDRALKSGETSHYYCQKCGAEVHEDFRHKHKCSPLTEFSKGGKKC
jgi:hypothetical protein